MDLIFIEQPNDKLIFEQLERSEILIVNNKNKFQIFVNIESADQSLEEKTRLKTQYNTELNDFMTYVWPRLQFMDLTQLELNEIFNKKISISKGWENEFKMAGIYVGWGVETFENEIELKKENGFVKLEWTFIVGDMDRYDVNFKPFKSKIEAELKIIEFSTEQEFLDYENEKYDKK